MTTYNPRWDLSKLPDDVWNAEQGRRCVLKRYGTGVRSAGGSIYNNWDLSTVPDEIWKSEHGRRQRAKGPYATNRKIKPCSKCYAPLDATQARARCYGCGYWHSRKEWREM